MKNRITSFLAGLRVFPFRLRSSGLCPFLLVVLVLSLGIGGLVEPLEAAERNDTRTINPIRDEPFYVGLHFPGVTLGYQGNGYNLELRASRQDDITVVGPRFSQNIYPFQDGNVYWGTDLFHVEFEDVIVEGTGKMGGVVGGLETYLGQYLSFSVDGGPYYVQLEDELSGVEVDGLEFVVNAGVKVHF